MFVNFSFTFCSGAQGGEGASVNTCDQTLPPTLASRRGYPKAQATQKACPLPGEDPLRPQLPVLLGGSKTSALLTGVQPPHSPPPRRSSSGTYSPPSPLLPNQGNLVPEPCLRAHKLLYGPAHTDHSLRLHY